jgi:hypothetical protein
MRNSTAAVERWFFYQDVANLWKWARIDVFGTVLGYSAASFGTRDESVADARRSGYCEQPVRAGTRIARAERRRLTRPALPTRF